MTIVIKSDNSNKEKGKFCSWGGPVLAGEPRRPELTRVG
jgi:hypothetical protein